MENLNLIKEISHQEIGFYKITEIDNLKSEVDFIIENISDNKLVIKTNNNELSRRLFCNFKRGVQTLNIDCYVITQNIFNKIKNQFSYQTNF